MHKLLLVLITCSVVTFAKLPAYIKKCSIKDPNFDSCALKNAKEAIPYLIKGDTKMKFPVMDPLFVTELRMTGQGLDAAILNNTVTGLKDIVLEYISFDFDKKEIKFQSFLPYLNFTGNYVVSGKLVSLPISGNGPYTSSFSNVSVHYNLTYELKKLDDGLVYMIFTDYDTDIIPQHLVAHLDNLFGGNQVLGEIVNKFLNENWRVINKDLGKSTSLAVGKILFNIFTDAAKTTPYNEMHDDVE